MFRRRFLLLALPVLLLAAAYFQVPCTVAPKGKKRSRFMLKSGFGGKK